MSEQTDVKLEEAIDYVPQTLEAALRQIARLKQSAATAHAVAGVQTLIVEWLPNGMIVICAPACDELKFSQYVNVGLGQVVSTIIAAANAQKCKSCGDDK